MTLLFPGEGRGPGARRAKARANHVELLRCACNDWTPAFAGVLVKS